MRQLSMRFRGMLKSESVFSEATRLRLRLLSLSYGHRGGPW